MAVEKKRTREVTNITEFLKVLADFQTDTSWVFRGQPTDKPLLPKVAREAPGTDGVEKEKLILREFERRIQAFGHSSCKNDWELLSLAQHFGLPTRMLDWSRSALAALWFACRKANENRKEKSVVWALQLKEADYLDVRAKESPFEISSTKFFEPMHVSNRISAQEGLFSVHKYAPSAKKFVGIDSNPAYSGRLVKVTIAPGHCDRVIENLEKCGTHAASMFPDMYGLAEFLSGKYKFSARSEEFERRAK